MLRLLVNALTADDKQYLLNKENLIQTIQMQLSQNKKLFMNFFFIFEVYIKFYTFCKN